MSIFKTYTFSWRQVGVLKLSVLCIGIAIGAHWAAVFAAHALLLVVLGVVLGLFLLWRISGRIAGHVTPSA